MPADRYEGGIRYDFGTAKTFQDSYIRLGAQQTLRQTRVPATGNIEKTQPDGSIRFESDYAPPPPAYMLVNVEMGTKFFWRKQAIICSITGNNLLNTAYRDYMNAFRYFAWDVGRNIGIRIQLPLGGAQRG